LSTNHHVVTLERENGLGVVRLSRDRGNAIDDNVLDGLMQAFGEAEQDPGLQGVILAADGKLFCPGLDLVYLSAMDRSELDRFMEKFAACLMQMYTFPKPVVAALSGHALAGGYILSMTADWRILRTGALVGLNELRVGVPLPFGVSMILRDTVISPRLEEVALFGRNYKDEAALASSLVHELCEPDDLMARAVERLEEMTSKDLNSFAVTKHYLRSATVERIEAREAGFRDQFLDCWFSPGTQERIRNLLDQLTREGSFDA
jgi:enoyl-CoA hydratase